MFSIDPCEKKNLQTGVKVLTFFWCQLLFLVLSKKPFKLWSNRTEIDHEIGFQLTGNPKAGHCFDSASSAGNKAFTYDEYGNSRLCG